MGIEDYGSSSEGGSIPVGNNNRVVSTGGTVSASTGQSKVDEFSGSHTNSLIVGGLLLLLILIFGAYILFKENYDNTVIAALSAAISLLIGYFAGSSNKK
ncbi:hypothetical protein LNQ81_07710 [Myroides sp. M-43]|uniref:hypothetical protein n=1 Tax=Myroides oncorhynchi TaxID=2893756 RepID=UPI001E39ACC7|nr:hypothetical protein [Myroides oncorhynchi]MCC9042574.1 hypothetical protein [Myroides oncorhynchi]